MKEDIKFWIIIILWYVFFTALFCVVYEWKVALLIVTLILIAIFVLTYFTIK